MALTDTGQTEKNVDTQQRPIEKKEKPLTKVVIRRLPPTMDEESFLQQVSPIPEYDYLYSVKGDFSLGENTFSRVYINFTSLDDIFSFKERFDNYVFLDTKGNEYPAVVEFAAFQKIPKKRNKIRPDPKCGTIETDPLYLEFLESLKEQPNSEEKPEFSYQITSENKLDTTTPLLEFVKQRRIERQRIKEERREERKRKELERRGRVKDESRKKFEERSPIKNLVLKSSTSNKSLGKDKVGEEENRGKDAEKADNAEKVETKPVEKVAYSSGYKKDRKFEERKSFNPRLKYQPKTEKKDYYEKPEYKPRKPVDKEKEKDDPKYNKKVKKYSERREERKNEAKKIESKKGEGESDLKPAHDDAEREEKKSADKPDTGESHKKQESSVKVETESNKEKESANISDCSNRGDGDKLKCKDSDPRAQRRIRNKDRPTMAIYQPGALSKRRHAETDGDGKETKSSTSNKE